MEYIIKLDQGDYYQQRGGNDWGRSGKSGATTFDSREQAQEEIDKHHLQSFGARIKEAY